MGESLRAACRQLLACLGRQALDAVIVEVTVNLDVLKAVHLVGILTLAAYISVILYENLCCLSHLVVGRQFRAQLLQSGESDARTCEELVEMY